MRFKWIVVGLVSVLSLAAVVGAVTVGGSSAATSFPCVGAPADQPVQSYPEPRVFLEFQSWTEPQPDRAGYMGSGMQGHIHIGMCWPLKEHVSSATLPLDIRIMAHMRTQPINFGLRMDQYPFDNTFDHINSDHCSNGVPDTTLNDPPLYGTVCFTLSNGGIDCPDMTCQMWQHEEMPVAGLACSGLSNMYIWVRSDWLNGADDWVYGTQWFYADNGQPPCDQSQNATDPAMMDGEAQYDPPSGEASVGTYARERIPFSQYPYDPATGKLTPVSGNWTFHPNCECEKMRVFVDPNQHATPPDNGTVLLMDSLPGSAGLTIDTTKLSNDIHYLLLAGGRTHPDGVTWWGVEKLPFIVQNDTTTTTSTTTTPTTTTTQTTTTPTTTTTQTTTTPPPSSSVSVVNLLNSADVNVPSGTDTVIPFDTETVDTDGYHSSTNPTRVTIPSDGRYVISVESALAANGTGQRWVHVRKNGTTDILSDTRSAFANLEEHVALSGEASLAAGDFLELKVYQNSGSALNALLAATHSQRTTLTVRKVG